MKKLNTVNVDEILAPRDEKGLLQPMEFAGGTGIDGKPMHYPWLPPLPGGQTVGLLCPEDFVPGGIYFGCVQYVPAFYNGFWGVMPDGTQQWMDFSKVVYVDPRYMMPTLQEKIQTQGLPRSAIPVAEQIVSTLLAQGIGAAVEEEPEEDVLYLPNGKGLKERICNCLLKVLALRRVVAGEKTSFEVELELTRRKPLRKTMSETVCVPLEEVERLDDVLGEKFPWFHLATETHAAGSRLSEYIREQLDEVMVKVVFRSPGWQAMGDGYIFVHDGLPDTEEMIFDCGKAILQDASLDSRGAFLCALDILKIGKKEVVLPLLLVALLGPLYRLFKEADCTPRFCAYLYGLSGSLKTSLAKVMYQMYPRQQHNSFRDTAAAVDVSIAEHRDRMFLMDDFQPAVIAAEGAAMRKTLEHVVRLFGDDIAKNRSNSHATATRGNRPGGSCLITGESVGGSYSSLLRCVLIPITRGDVDGEALRIYQENHALFTSNYAFMLPWVGRHWAVLQEKIRREFPGWRDTFGRVTAEPRLADAGAVMMLAGEIFLRYGISCGGMDERTMENILAEWRCVLEELLSHTTYMAQDVDVVKVTQEAIAFGLDTGALKVAADVMSYQAGLDGFYTADRLWLHPAAFQRVVRQYCAENQVTCLREMKALLAELYRRGVILRDEEAGKESYLKRCPSMPALDGRRPRMIAFDRTAIVETD